MYGDLIFTSLYLLIIISSIKMVSHKLVQFRIFEKCFFFYFDENMRWKKLYSNTKWMLGNVAYCILSDLNLNISRNFEEVYNN